MNFEEVKDVYESTPDIIILPFRNGDLNTNTFWDDAIYYRTLKPEIRPIGPGHKDISTERAGLTITTSEKSDLETTQRDLIKALSVKRDGKQWFIEPNFTKEKLFDNLYQKTLLLKELYLG